MTAAPRDDAAVLLELFSADARSAGADLQRSIALILDGGAKPESVLRELLQATRSVRSAARIVGIEAAAQIALEMENCLVRVQQKETSFDDALTRAMLAGAEAVSRLGAVPAQTLRDFASDHADYVDTVLSTLRARHEPTPSAAAKPRLSIAPRSAEGAAAPNLGRADARLLALFRTEASTCAAALNDGLIRVESGDASALDGLMRAAHSFKGALRAVGFEAWTQLAHALEDCFVSAQRGSVRLTERHVDQLLKAVDSFSELANVPAADLDAWQHDQAARAEELARILMGLADADVQSLAPSVSVTPKALPAKSSFRAPVGVASKAPQESVPLDTSGEERVLRVTASSINRLMGLAGESLVESRHVQALTGATRRLKRRQAELDALLEKLDEGTGSDPDQHGRTVAEARARTRELRTLLNEHVAELEAHARRNDDLSERLYREALKSRMRPFRDGVQALPRIVRDVARQLGKKARLEITGESTGVDRDVLESLEAPLNHLLRNAVDHGLESPAERVSRGKPEQGLIRVEARHHAGVLAITVSDDGAGIDPERLRSKIVDRKLLRADVAARLSSAEIFEFIFLPGFSTARQVTEISGRGVGLDAVRSAVEAASGTVRVASEVAKGTQFQIQLPVTRSVLRAVVADIGGETYAFPLLRIERILRIPAASVKTIGNLEYAVVNGENVALISARQVLGFGAGAAASEDVAVVVLGDRKRRYGLVVDKFLGEHDLVVRTLDRRLGKIQDVAAAAILMDGSIGLIVDVEDVMRSIEKLAESGRLDRLAHTASARKRKRVLVVDDSITVREAERQLLVNRGYEVDVAVDGIDGWNSVRDSSYDLLIVDIDMPRMNGIDLVRTIRKDARLETLPIVIVSYKDRAEDRLRGLNAGANQYLTKSSFHDDTLVRVVEDLIGAAGA